MLLRNGINQWNTITLSIDGDEFFDAVSQLDTKIEEARKRIVELLQNI